MAFPRINSDTEVINLALVRLGHSAITDENDDSPAGILARATYDLTRRSMLELHPWNFATKWVELAEGTLPAAAAARYARAYNLPGDFLRMREVEFESTYSGEDWEVGDGQLWTNLGGATIRCRYTYNHTVVPEWSPEFIDALAARLEQDWADNLVKDSATAQRKLNQYETAVARARTSDSSQATPRQQAVGSWVRNR